MSPKHRSTSNQRLRQKAESSLGATRSQVKKMTTEEAQELVHELQVHQIELEMQNEELRRAQLELEEARDRYATLYDLTPVGYVTLNERGGILEANLTFCHLLGVPRGELLRKKFEEFLDQADQPAFRTHMQALQMKPGTQSSDIMTLRHQTHLHRVRLESSLDHRNPQSTGDLFRMTVIDVTERERIRKLQEEQKALMEVVIGGIMDAIVTVDENEQIVLFNRAAEILFRCSASSVIGQKMDRLIPGRFREVHHLHHHQFLNMAELSGPIGFSREITALRTDGEEFPAEVTVSKVEAKGWGSRSKKLFAVVLRDITERREAQEALQKEQQFISAILDTAAALIIVTDTKGRIVRFNRACEILTGFTFEEVQHQPFWDILLPATDMEEVKEYFYALIKGRVSSLHENHWITKKKKLRGIAWSNSVLKDHQGAVKYVIGSGIDLTEQRNIQRALKKEQRFIKNVLDTAGALVVILNSQWQLLRMNRMCENLLQQPIQDVQGRPFWNFLTVSGEEEECARQLLDATKAGRLPYTVECALMDRAGKLRWIQWNVTASYTKRGEVEYFVATGTDVSDRKHAERLLQQNEHQLQAILDYSPVSIWLKDLHGRYVKVNRQFERQAGLKETDILGKTDAEIFSDRAALYEDADRQVFQTGQAVEFDEIAPDSIRTEHVYKFPLTTPQGTPYALCGIATDITQRKQTELLLQETSEHLKKQHQELQSLSAQLLSAQEEERRRISRDLHDDVNQRLALLSLKLQSAANTLVDDHLVRPLLQDLDKSVAELSDDIRHLAFQYHPSILDDLGLGSALRSLCEDFSRWEKIRITCELPEATRQIPQNVASCLYRVAQESLRNVSKHARASAAHLVLKEDKQDIFCVIRDNGRGFLLKEKLPQGLGFVSMKERVRLVGGTIAVESQTGQGTTVRVSIPKEANYT